MSKNHLSNETSPYLIEHVENPVDWYPWGEAAFDKAKAEDKPIFLSIGYSACHWCHVMAHESFENATTAALLNKSFVSIKVDREERPDIDNVYMAACQRMTGSGGWPLNLFLMPDGRPFFAGTYFPKTAYGGMPSFNALLQAVESAWKTERQALNSSAELISSRLKQQEYGGAAPDDPIGSALNLLEKSFDNECGGFGSAPKFPSPHIILFLLQQYEKHGHNTALEMADKTLTKMYQGGLFDHIGGGFCRYSTDRSFLIPHFEKMLYDNALLMIAYSKAFELTKSGIYLTASKMIASYLLREMQAENGGFFSSQDADSEGKEGFYYLFSPDEVISVLGEAVGKAFNAHFDITPEGNFEGKSIPNLLKSGESSVSFEHAKTKLLEYRSNRTRLSRDDKQLAFWNALTVAAFCTLYRVCGEKKYLETAKAAHLFIENALYKNGELHSSCCRGKLGSKAFLDDHAALALARIALYEATLEESFLDKAKECAKLVLEHYFDNEAGGFFFSGSQNESLITNTKETYDGALPSGNSIITYVLARLCVLAPDHSIESALEKQLDFMRKASSAYPAGYAMFLIALSDHLEPAVKLVAVGCGAQEKAALPLRVPVGVNIRFFEHETHDCKLLNGKPTYYVCKGKTCIAPTNEFQL